MAYGIIPSQLLRYYNACSSIDDFIVNTNMLVTKLLQQNYDREKIVVKINQFISKNKLVKYNTNEATLKRIINEDLPSNVQVTGRPWSPSIESVSQLNGRNRDLGLWLTTERSSLHQMFLSCPMLHLSCPSSLPMSTNYVYQLCLQLKEHSSKYFGTDLYWI